MGYPGDGINDAPALHAADVGISVDDAVDVGRESADIVLLRPNLDVLCQGIEHGRRTFVNSLKYISMTISANFGNMVSMAIAAPLLPFLPLAAKQIPLNNFLSDLPSIALSVDHVDEERLVTAQHWDVSGLRRFMILFGLTSTLFDPLTFWLLREVFDADAVLIQTTWFTVSLLIELGVVLVLRTYRPFWRSQPGGLLAVASIAVAVGVFSLPDIEPLARLFDMRPLPPALRGATVLIVLAYLVATEAVKRYWARTIVGTPARSGSAHRAGRRSPPR